MPLPAWVERYVGIPYVTGGTTAAGTDCWGLLALVWREQFGRELPLYAGEHWRAHSAPNAVGGDAAQYVAQFEHVPAGGESLGDGVLLRMRGYPLHVGLVLEPGLMLHAHEMAASCVESYRNWRWARRVVGFYRYAP